MNPPAWEDAFRRMQRHLAPPPYRAVNDLIYCEHSPCTADKSHNSTGVNVGWEELCPPSHNSDSKESEGQDPDGEPLEIDEEDAELMRKWKELREIEERIIFKKAAIALKTVEPFVKQTAAPGLSCYDQSATCQGGTLRDRVNRILKEQRSLGFLSEVGSSKRRMNSSSPVEDHPLKMRVKALMKQRSCDPYVLPTNTKVPDVKPPPPSQNSPSLDTKENSDYIGFQRFLSVLNKGVDIDLLSRIVNNDSEDLSLGEELINIHPTSAEHKPESSNSGASVLGRGQAKGGEAKNDRPSGESSENDRLSLSGDEEKTNDRGESSFRPSYQSNSPLAVKKKKEEKEKTKVEEQREQLKNILQTLGLSLEVEEMSKLTDRTQERLYGKKHEGRIADRSGEQEGQQRGFHRHYRDMSSSSRSTSRSPSPSRSCSHSRDSKLRRASDSMSSDGLTCKDCSLDSKEAQDTDSKDPKQSSYHHDHCDPYSQDQIYSNPQPPVFSDGSVSEYSQYTDYHSCTSHVATHSYSTCTQSGVPYLEPNSHLYPQITDLHPPGAEEASSMAYPYYDSSEDLNLLVNPDLSKSEGQLGSAGGRCLREISTMPSTSKHCLTQVIKGRRQNLAKMKKCQSWFLKLRESKQPKRQARQAMQNIDFAEKMQASQGDEDQEEATLSEDEERPPTEEEIKANLRKKICGPS
ncbi:uncharacterized protein LOC115047722 [Echeneis naucrates]|uniref:uncharacterized protein LOC115047722 n=1 Tax=Echeneis naucrates TaxID=173247 RepID=UPI001113C80B|nr:uncharacterized protein LOC115047722 [Echeneis naucrates]